MVPDEKEDNVLGSILLPSFHVSMLSVDDHISKKYAFKVTCVFKGVVYSEREHETDLNTTEFLLHFISVHISYSSFTKIKCS